jgi:HK97 gp10 family phage protein
MRLQATATWKPRSDLGRYVETHVTPAVRASVLASVRVIEQAAKAIVPVDTGALRESITSDVDDSGRTIVGRVGPHTHYAAYVEFGTGIAGAASAGHGAGPYSPTWAGMPAQPYMRPALDEHRAGIAYLFRREIALALR